MNKPYNILRDMIFIYMLSHMNFRAKNQQLHSNKREKEILNMETHPGKLIELYLYYDSMSFCT